MQDALPYPPKSSTSIISGTLMIGLIAMWLLPYRTPSQSGFFLGDAIALICLVTAFILSKFDGKTLIPLPREIPSYLWLPTLALVLWWSIQPHFSARSFLKDVAQFSFYITYCWVLVNACNSEKSVNRILEIALYITATVVLFQIAGYLMFSKTNVLQLLERQFSNLLWLSDGNMIRIRGNELLLTGPFQNRNQLGMLAAAMFTFFYVKNSTIAYSTALALTIASGSRTGLAIISIAVLIMIIREVIVHRHLSRRSLIFLALITLALATIGDFIVLKLKRLLSESGDSSANMRLVIYQQYWTGLKEHWLLGAGFGQLRTALNLDNVENSWGRLLVEFGLIGIIFIFYILRGLVTPFLNFKLMSKTQKSLAMALMLLAISGLLQPFLWQSQIAPFFIFLMFSHFMLFELQTLNGANEENQHA